MDSTQFKADMNLEFWDEHVRQDFMDGMDLGLVGVPCYFVNGIKVPGANRKTLETVIEHQLGEAR